MSKLKMKWYDVLLQILLSVLLFLLFLSSSVFLTLAFKPLYYLDIKALDIPKTSGYDEKTIKENYDALIDYNLPLRDGDLSFPSLPMSAHGKQHFEEVKDIFDAFKVLALVCIPLCGVGVFYFHTAPKKLYLPLTAGLTVVLPLLGGLLIALNWERVFVSFHELFFDNDYWIFDSTYDPVITILPDAFFMHCAVMILSLLVFCGIVCLAIFGFTERKRKRGANDADTFPSNISDGVSNGSLTCPVSAVTDGAQKGVTDAVSNTSQNVTPDDTPQSGSDGNDRT